MLFPYKVKYLRWTNILYRATRTPLYLFRYNCLELLVFATSCAPGEPSHDSRSRYLLLWSFLAAPMCVELLSNYLYYLGRTLGGPQARISCGFIILTLSAAQRQRNMVRNMVRRAKIPPSLGGLDNGQWLALREGARYRSRTRKTLNYGAAEHLQQSIWVHPELSGTGK